MNDKTECPAQITMYTTSWCPSVRMARYYLDRLGVEYTEVDIDKVPGAAQKLERWTGGYRTVPTFDVDGEIVIDFNVAKLKSLLGI